MGPNTKTIRQSYLEKYYFILVIRYDETQIKLGSALASAPNSDMLEQTFCGGIQAARRARFVHAQMVPSKSFLLERVFHSASEATHGLPSDMVMTMKGGQSCLSIYLDHDLEYHVVDPTLYVGKSR